MLAVSETLNFAGDAGIKHVLVFNSQEQLNRFRRNNAQLSKFQVLAIKADAEKWECVVKDTLAGANIYNSTMLFDTFDIALSHGVDLLLRLYSKS